MKKAFPGDPEFSWKSFYHLPYEYVLLGFYQLLKLQREELHALEMPVALSTAVYANSQRDPKAQKKPYSPLDFSLYKQIENNGPNSYSAACYMALVTSGRLPAWALFCYKDVSSSSNKPLSGPLSALIAHDAILVAPRKTELGMKGLLIAQESASDQVRQFRDLEGNVLSLRLPLIHTKVIAEEGATLSQTATLP